MMGCNIRLRRFELLDSHNVSASVLLQFLEKCSGITHLSLSGSTLDCDCDENGTTTTSSNNNILYELPRVLPQLQVLDVTRCSNTWITTKSMIFNMLQQYSRNRKQQQQQQQEEEGKTAIQLQNAPEVYSDFGWFHPDKDSFYYDDDDDW